MQIEDFLGKIVEVVLDLSNGFKPYLKLFRRPPRFYRRVRKLKGRVLDKAQWRLDNFTGRYLRGQGYLLLRRLCIGASKGGAWGSPGARATSGTSSR